jgi:hypothetical protein
MPETKEVLWLVRPDDEPLELSTGTRFWKELISEGRWANPAAGFTLDVDGERLGRWLANFEAMTDAGIRVPVPWGHSYDPRDNAGFVSELELRDGALWGLLDVPDAAAAEKLGRTVRAVSVSVNPHFVDGSGRDWGEVIEHVALTNYPVVTGQGEFVRADDAERSAITLEPAEPDAASDDSDSETDTGEDTPPEPRTPAADQRNPALETRLYQLELERAEREVDDAVRAGKFTRPAAQALRRLGAAGVARRYAFGPPTGDARGADVLALAREVIAGTPPGAAVDMTERTRVHVVPEHGAGMTAARAARLADENRKLAGV